MLRMDKKYNFVFIFIALAIADQLVKYLIRQSGGFYVCNKGIAFSLPMPWWIIYSVFFIFFLLAGFYLIERISLKEYLINKYGLTLLVGGALGNIIDRLNYGCVTDFINLMIFPVFNLADIFIFIGVILIFFRSNKK